MNIEIILEFFAHREKLLNSPAQEEDFWRVQEAYPGFWRDMQGVYAVFNGERDWGALLSGVRVMTLAEAMSACDDIKRLVSEDEVFSTKALQFVPWIATSRKTHFVWHPGGVSELDYEGGIAIHWATSAEAFLQSLVRIALSRLSLGRDLERMKWVDFSIFELEMLAGSGCFRFPFLPVEACSESLLLSS